MFQLYGFYSRCVRGFELLGIEILQVNFEQGTMHCNAKTI